MSQARLASCIPLPLEHKALVTVIEKAKDWALMHGVGMRDKNKFTKDAIQIAPFVLLPSPFPRTEFNKAVELQTVLNELMHKVAHDEEFLEQTLQNALQVDEFTANLYNIWVKVREEGIAQPISLGMLRSDIMLESRCPHTENQCAKHTPYCSWKQVEINSIASGFGHLGPVSRDIQSYILRQLGHGDLIKNMPPNPALAGLCSGITEAYDLFGVPEAVVLFVVEEVSYNICDQRFHEFYISENRPEIMIYRKTLNEIFEETELNDKKQLILDGHPVAVVYYRSGYEPAQYPSTREWDARLRVERSTAIKCPSIQYQLAGTKKVQQALAGAGALERLMGSGAASERVRDIFTGLYSLDFDEGGERAIDMALQDAERSVSGYVVRPGAPVPPPVVDLVSELGIFGVIIGSKDKIVSNRQAGHMLRTKLADADEGGVAAGLGALDSPYLLDLLVIRIRCDAENAQCPLGIKFGCDPVTEAPRLLKLAAVLGLNVVGISFHVGSGAGETAVYARAIQHAHNLFQLGTAAGHRMELLDIGGGFPGNTNTSIREVSAVINASLEKWFPSRGVRVIAEPGRYFAAAAYTLAAMIYAKRELNTVEGTGEEPHTMYFINDGVYGSFNCVLYDHQHVVPQPLEVENSRPTACSIWGPSCDGLDCVVAAARLPALSAGSWLVFRDMGAYTLPVASPFNGFPTPRVHAVVDVALWSTLQQLWLNNQPQWELATPPSSPIAFTEAEAFPDSPESPSPPESPASPPRDDPPVSPVFVECALK